MRKEQFRYIIGLITPIALYALSFTAFSKALKQQAITERGCACEKCRSGEVYLYPHHILPEQMGGNDELDNLFLACSDCHPGLDRQAIKHGRLANGLSVLDIPTDAPELVGDRNKFDKALHRFSGKIKKFSF